MPAPWRVDVVNLQSEVIVSINAWVDAEHPNGAAWAWLVPVGPRVALLDEPSGLRAATIEVINPIDCRLLARAEIAAASVTLRIESSGGSETPRLTIEPGATAQGRPRTDYHGGCSG